MIGLNGWCGRSKGSKVGEGRCSILSPHERESGNDFEPRPSAATSGVRSKEAWFQAVRPRQNKWQCLMDHRRQPQ
jgi:hypothetical protein